MRRALPIMILICALGGAALAQAGYKAVPFEGKIGDRGERRPFSMTYEKLSKTKRLVNEAHFTKLPVSCKAPGSDKSVEGVLAAFNQPTEAWVLNKDKKIGGRKNFAKVWKGRGVPIESPEGDKTKFRGKRAEFSGKFRKGYRKAQGRFSIQWKEVEASSGDVLFSCSAQTAWSAKRKRR